MCAMLHFNRDGEELRRIRKNLDVDKVEIIIDTAQAQLMNLMTRDSGV